jgi:thiol:disulfide interchange protein DsbD
MKHAFLLFLCLGWLLAGSIPAQNKARGTLYGRLEGEEAKLALEISIDPGWHLYHGPTEAEMSPDGATGMPTKVEFRGEGFEWEPLEFPTPETVEQESFDEGPPLHIRQHHGTIVLRVKGKAAPGASLSTIEAIVSGNTCQDDGVCIRYDETLRVTGSGLDTLFPAASRAPAGPTASTKPPIEAPGATSTPAQGTDTGLWWFLLSAVGWGLFTLLMPCTYPMIPITISYFTKQAAQRKTGTLPLSLAYGIGIVLIFVLIGVVVGPLIIRFATHPVTNLIIGGFFLLFALALFGIVDLQPPRFLLSAAGKASSQGGFFGVFLMGATLVVTSFTCTAPFVGTLLSTGASSGDLGRVALGMGVFGATMAIPFVFLSMVPGKVQALPRSGEWMHVLKVTLGFVEIAAALKFISNVDLVWQWGFLTRELFLVLWLGIFLVAGLYLFGQIRLKGESTSEISPGRMVAGLFFSLFALYCGYGAFGNPMDPIMTAIIPNYSGRIASAGDRSGPPVAAHTIVKDDYEGALAQAKSEGKLLLVNFTGFT